MTVETHTDTRIDDPQFDKAGRVHDWRNYISEKIAALWPTLNREQRAALIEQAEEMAGREEWD